MSRDYYTGLDLEFERTFEPSDGFDMYQFERTTRKPRVKKTAKPNEKLAGRVAVMQALRYHFGKSCKEIALLMGFENCQGRNAKGVKMVSHLTLANDPNYGRDWWSRQYKQEAIEAARKLL